MICCGVKGAGSREAGRAPMCAGHYNLNPNEKLVMRDPSVADEFLC